MYTSVWFCTSLQPNEREQIVRLPRNVSTPPMATSRSLGVRDRRHGGSTWKATTCISFYVSVCVWACVVHVIAEQGGYVILYKEGGPCVDTRQHIVERF